MISFDTVVGLVSEYSPSGQERRAVEWLVARMKSLGYDRAFVDDAGNAVGVMGQGPRQMVLLGHIDTVPGEIPVRVDDGVLYGRGSVDAKGPLACFVDAVAEAGARDGWQLVVIGAVEEERDSQGARFVAAQYRPDLAVIGEPNRWDRIALGYKGNVGVKITVRREQTHSASGEETAAEAAVYLWLQLKAQAQSINADRQKAFEQLLLTLRSIRSDATDFEQCAQLEIGARLPVGVSPEGWYEEIARRAGDAVVEPIGFAMRAWSCEKNTRLVRAFVSAIRSGGGEPRFVYKTGTSDLNIVAPAWKCPAMVYGPGDSALDHTPQEHLSLEEYARSVQVLGQVLQQIS